MRKLLLRELYYKEMAQPSWLQWDAKVITFQIVDYNSYTTQGFFWIMELFWNFDEQLLRSPIVEATLMMDVAWILVRNAKHFFKLN